ncbi:MAG TPA: polysaccharide biosynthesis/export family protein [Hyphomonadaceae bacterium]|nr:polysaccharide biosynthesis/export family protein [Hyphomonadaceae bacterium]
MLRACLSRPSALLGVVLASAALAGCMGDPLPKPSKDFAVATYPSWKAEDQSYRFYPGDKLRIDIRTAPELSGELTIAPDGRVSLANIGPVMAAGRTVKELQDAIEDIYGNELIDPSLVITPTGFGSQKIFVGGEVKQPGVFELPGEIDPLQAILLAGGWTENGKSTHVIVMRRAPGGQMMTRVVDVRAGLAKQQLYDIGPMKRFDVVYVTRKAISDENLFVKQFIRDALPIDFSLFYDVARF